MFEMADIYLRMCLTVVCRPGSPGCGQDEGRIEGAGAEMPDTRAGVLNLARAQAGRQQRTSLLSCTVPTAHANFSSGKKNVLFIGTQFSILYTFMYSPA